MLAHRSCSDTQSAAAEPVSANEPSQPQRFPWNIFLDLDHDGRTSLCEPLALLNAVSDVIWVQFPCLIPHSRWSFTPKTLSSLF